MKLKPPVGAVRLSRSFKILFYSGTNQVTVLMNESLNPELNDPSHILPRTK